MKKVLVSMLLVCTFAATSLSTTGCFGSFTAVNKLSKWNSKATGNKYINGVISLVLSWLYSICFGIDIVFLNTMEFWLNSNPLAQGDTYRETDANGNSVTAVKMEDGSLYMRIDANTGESKELVLQRDEEIIRILDTKGNLLKEAAYAE